MTKRMIAITVLLIVLAALTLSCGDSGTPVYYQGRVTATQELGQGSWQRVYLDNGYVVIPGNIDLIKGAIYKFKFIQHNDWISHDLDYDSFQYIGQ